MLRGNRKIIFNALLFIVAICKVDSECPDDSLLAPCSCNDDEHITCDGDKQINFCEMLAKLAKKLPDDQKDYEMFILSNSAVEEIPENCFEDIYFREIQIKNAINLKKIHLNAFKGTDQLTERFLFSNSPLFGPSNPPTLIFDILNKFKKLDAITLENIGLKEIPDNAFQAHDLLVWLSISGLSVEKICANAFSALNGLTEIHITNTSISEVTNDVFVFGKSEVPLDICLFNNKKMTTFSEQAFTQTGRPTDLDFSGYKFSKEIYAQQMPIFEDKVFLPFLKANDLNKIEMEGLEFNCNECKNAWVKKDTDILKRIENVKCTDGKAVTDSFENCK